MEVPENTPEPLEKPFIMCAYVNADFCRGEINEEIKDRVHCVPQYGSYMVQLAAIFASLATAISMLALT